MLISVDWIKDFTKIPSIDPSEIAKRFTMATAEIEAIHTTGEHLEKISVVEIVSIEKHPDAEKLNLVTFKVSPTETKRVVCGASNVAVGLRVPYAPLGTKFPSGLVLEPKSIRGVVSEGMLCSEQELGKSVESHGLMILPSDAPIGMKISEFLNEKNDIIIDIDNKSLTHRPDLWGHYGMAREFATVFEKELRDPFHEDWKNSLLSKFSGDSSPVKPVVDEDSACLGFYGACIDNVTVTDSPLWMKDRLTAVGLRPINNIVDISNYVMLELGIPLHIFNRKEIFGTELFIKRVTRNEKFKTLDDVERELALGDTIISDKNKILSLAGIMGGVQSGVSPDTSQIFIEVANWKASEIRRTSTRLGLRTDASMRYEKTLDSQLLLRTLLRTIELVLKSCPKAHVVGNLSFAGVDSSAKAELVIKTSVEKINSVLGITIPPKRIIDIFESLDFKVKNIGDEFLEVTVPSYRATKDVEFEEDLIEEIGRIIGYDNIEPVAPYLKVRPAALTGAQKLVRRVKEFLVFNGQALEVLTYPMIGKKLIEKAQLFSGKELKLFNALSEDSEYMRPSLVPSILETASKNVKNLSEFKFFEIGRVYLPGKENFSVEETHLAVAFFNKDTSPFMSLLNVTEKLLNSQNMPAEIVGKHEKFKNILVDDSWEGFHPYEFQNIKIMGKMNGLVASIHPLLLREFKIKGHLSIALINLSLFDKNELKDKKNYKPLPKFPSSKFDCTVVMNQEIEAASSLESLKKVKFKELVGTKIIDVYTIDEKLKSVTLRSTFLDPEKTLDPANIKKMENAIVDALLKSGFPLKTV